MLSIFKQYLEDNICVTEEEWAFIEPLARLASFQKNSLVLRAGDHWEIHAFITKGCVSTYIRNEDDYKSIISFDCEKSWIGDGEALISGIPSRFYIEAIEDTELLLIAHADFELICKNIKAFQVHANAVRYSKFVNSNKKIHAAFAYSAKGRYQNFLNQYPNLVLRVPQNMIASYLGINTETLSRVRKSISKGKNKS